MKIFLAKNWKVLVISLMLCALLLPISTSASKIGTEITANLNKFAGEEGAGYDIDKNNLQGSIGAIIGVLLGFAGIVMVVVIIYGGFLWMTAGGDEAKVDKAKKYVKNAIIGLIIILAAYMITYFVTEQIDSSLIEAGVDE